MFKKSLIAATILYSVSSIAYAGDTDGLKRVFVDDAKVKLSTRYRLENVDDAAFTDDSTASTLRTTLNYQTGKMSGFSGTLEFQNVALLGSESYNDSINGVARPTIADPELTAVNQAFISFSGIDDTVISVGRKNFNFDNMRFINKNNWRQHHQSFDSASVVNKSLPDTTVNYVYVNSLNRSNGSDHPTGQVDTNFHLLNAKYTGLGFADVIGYGYWLDYDNAAFFAVSSKTYGLRLTGDTPITDGGLKLLYTAEYAHQSDHGDNAANYSAGYYLAELGVGGSNWSAKLGHEVLQADGVSGAFTTPLGTGHGFHGWADRFGSGPAAGIEDSHVKLSYKTDYDNYPLLSGIKFDARYHDFQAEQGGADYGDEVDLRISKKFLDHYSASLTYANYNAATFSTDTEKWFLDAWC